MGKARSATTKVVSSHKNGFTNNSSGEIVRNKEQRRLLKVHKGKTVTCRGIFERFGYKGDWDNLERTMLITEIESDNGIIMADHCWFDWVEEITQLERAGLKKGDRVRFIGRIIEYKKGRTKKMIDYKIGDLQKMEIIERGDES